MMLQTGFSEAVVDGVSSARYAKRIVQMKGTFYW